MKAALLTAFGPPEALTVTEVPDPVLSDGMIRVRVRAIGVNFADVFARMGVYPSIPKVPFVPGIEFAGTVVEKGRGVSGLKPGTRVVGFSRQGAYAEQVCVPAQYVIPIPAAMSFEKAASFLVTYLSAWHGMQTLAHAAKGETVLVHAAAGGVGTAALQLGRTWGCRMIGTASTAAKVQVAREQGADHAINYVEGDFEERVRTLLGGNGVDIVMDSIGGSVMRRSLRLLAPMGRYVLYGFAAASGKRRLSYLRLFREALSFPFIWPGSLPGRNVSLMGFNLYFLADNSAYLMRAGTELLRLFRTKKIDPLIGKVFPFEQVVDAHTYLQGRHSVGKVVLSVG